MLAVATLAVLPLSAEAARPLVTEDTDTLEPGELEVELSFDTALARKTRLFLVPAGPVLNFGVLPRLEAAVGPSFVILAPDHGPTRAGPGDLGVRMKYRVIDETPRVPALMGVIAALLPTGDESRGLGLGSADIQLLAAASKMLGPATFTWNGGYTVVTRDRSLDLVNVYGSVDGSVGADWSVAAELVSDIATSRAGNTRVIVRAGATYQVTQRLQLDAAIGSGLTRASPDVIVTVGLTLMFK